MMTLYLQATVSFPIAFEVPKRTLAKQEEEEKKRFSKQNLLSKSTEKVVRVVSIRVQFHQHSTRSFCTSCLAPVKYKPKT